ncbi:MAG: XRE family transcriptional regulator [Gammaproteobacteria bacterium]|nr:XRE family transcriptional regulator [Gammaproteobacteria bacterium]MBQ0840032.1 XRE family transcriptional regulator [Gammaproteobacteria bacterium]
MASITYKNIFEAVTDDQEEANELQTRADLMSVIRDIVVDNGWKQSQVAEKIGLTQPRVSDLLNGKIEKFSIDLLMTCLFRLGFRFKPSYKNHKLTMTVQAA